MFEDIESILTKDNKELANNLLEHVDEMAICFRLDDNSWDVISTQSCESMHNHMIKSIFSSTDSPFKLFQ